MTALRFVNRILKDQPVVSGVTTSAVAVIADSKGFAAEVSWACSGYNAPNWNVPVSGQTLSGTVQFQGCIVDTRNPGMRSCTSEDADTWALIPPNLWVNCPGTSSVTISGSVGAGIYFLDPCRLTHIRAIYTTAGTAPGALVNVTIASQKNQ